MIIKILYQVDMLQIIEIKLNKLEKVLLSKKNLNKFSKNLIHLLSNAQLTIKMILLKDH
jgi:hypothetical protein